MEEEEAHLDKFTEDCLSCCSLVIQWWRLVWCGEAECRGETAAAWEVPLLRCTRVLAPVSVTIITFPATDTSPSRPRPGHEDYQRL